MRTATGLFLAAVMASAAPSAAQTAPAAQPPAVPPKPAGLWDAAKGMPAPGPKPITTNPAWIPKTSQEHGHAAGAPKPVIMPTIPTPPRGPAPKPASTS